VVEHVGRAFGEDAVALRVGVGAEAEEDFAGVVMLVTMRLRLLNAKKIFCEFLIERDCLERIYDVDSHLPRADELRIVIRQKGFRVKALAVHVGLNVRTLERRFDEQFHTTPKAWITRERMTFAPPLLAEGLSNKQIAASLSYTCESNFCRDFKRHFGCAPQEFARLKVFGPAYVAF
jgi:AraC-like DNA-binding protein